MRKNKTGGLYVVLSSNSSDKLVLGSQLRVLGPYCKELKGFY
jgi:hypothetical protein